VKRLLQKMRRKKAEEFSLRFTYERKHESIIRPIRIGIGLFIFPESVMKNNINVP
jgi:hypothetical protein